MGLWLLKVSSVEQVTEYYPLRPNIETFCQTSYFCSNSKHVPRSGTRQVAQFKSTIYPLLVLRSNLTFSETNSFQQRHCSDRAVLWRKRRNQWFAGHNIKYWFVLVDRVPWSVGRVNVSHWQWLLEVASSSLDLDEARFALVFKLPTFFPENYKTLEQKALSLYGWCFDTFESRRSKIPTTKSS